MIKASVLYFYICFTLLSLGGYSSAFAQDEDNLPEDREEFDRPLTPVFIEEGTDIDDLPFEEVDSVSGLDPGKSLFFSAVLPGLGQAYNGSHWKIPLIYIGGVFVISNVNRTNRRYSTALRNLRLITLDPLAELPYDQSRYQRETEFYRRNRDYTIIMGTLLYGLNILDAYVDAHLQDFDINDELAVRVKPALIPVPGGPTGLGIAVTFNIK